MRNAPKLETNLQIRLTNAERTAFNEMRDDEEHDPISKSIKQLDRSRHDVTSQLSAVMDGYGGSTKADAIAKLLRMADTVQESLKEMSNTIVENCPPREAIDILANLYKHHDYRMAENIAPIGQRGKMPLWSDDTIRQYAVSYTDPEHVRVLVDDYDENPFYILEREQVIDKQNDKLVNHLHLVLEGAPKNKYEHRRSRRDFRQKILVGGVAIAASVFGNHFIRKNRR